MELCFQSLIELRSVFRDNFTFTKNKMDLELREKLEKCYIWSVALYGAENWTLRAVDQKHLGSFEM
jgi:hypothetical protein